MKLPLNKITLNLDKDIEVSVTGFIAPIEYTQYNFHVEWDELANFQVAEPEKQYPTSIFQSFLPSNYAEKEIVSVMVGVCCCFFIVPLWTFLAWDVQIFSLLSLLE